MIPPALTKKEWAERGYPVVRGYVEWDMQVVEVHCGSGYGGDEEQEARFIPALIALANAALPDDDVRKITWKHVGLIEALADSAVDAEHSREEQALARSLADTLASYLPPR